MSFRDTFTSASFRGWSSIGTTPTGNWTLQTQIQSGAREPGGIAFSKYGDYCIMGSPNVNTNTGEALIYIRNGTTWTLQATLPGPAPSSNFGWCVSINSDGTYAAISAPAHDTPQQNIGLIQIYKRTSSTWTLEATLQPAGLGTDYFFGSAGIKLSDDGSRLIANALPIGVSTPQKYGRAYIFFRSGTTWTLEQTITAAIPVYGDGFGDSVNLNGAGDIAIIGYPGFDTPLANCGAIHVYTRSGTTWTLQSVVQSATPSANEGFGGELDINDAGNVMIVGSAGYDGFGTNFGGVYVFTKSGTTWTQQTVLIGSNITSYVRFGIAVALNYDGTWITAGAPDAPGLSAGVGAIYVFKNVGGTWSQDAILYTPDSTPPTGDFGIATAISYENGYGYIAGGDPTRDSFNDPMVYIFANNQ